MQVECWSLFIQLAKEYSYLERLHMLSVCVLPESGVLTSESSSVTTVLGRLQKGVNKLGVHHGAPCLGSGRILMQSEVCDW